MITTRNESNNLDSYSHKGPRFAYENRIVIFLDVLGFKNKLNEFEKEANESFESGESQLLISESVNDFIETFCSNIEVLKSIYADEMSHYLFSDNMCLSINYTQNYDTLIDVLFTVCDLFQSFAFKGYFLRGAIDIGLFIDKSDLAIGTPLSRAYELETEHALFPRFLISDRYMQKIKDCASESLLKDTSLSNFRLLIQPSCEFNYLNIFGNVITIGSLSEKANFFKSYFDSIKVCLKANKSNEKIYRKYLWLKNDLTDFINKYTENIYSLEPDLSAYEKPEINKFIKTLRRLA